jgi:hypothetical protein
MGSYRKSSDRIEHMMRWATYWQSAPTTGVNFAEIATAEDVASARRFCPQFHAGQSFCDCTDAEILAVAELVRWRRDRASATPKAVRA